MPPFESHNRVPSIAEPRRAQALAVRVLAYVAGLWSLAIIAGHVMSGSPGAASVSNIAPKTLQTPTISKWTTASRPHPAFAVSQSDFAGKSESYDILRHPGGGRKDVMRWAPTADDKTAMELEIYRPGSESQATTNDFADIATRLGLAGADVETAGMIDTKFGPVSAINFRGQPREGRVCLGFVKNIDSPRIRLSGYSCLQQPMPAQRAAIGCLFNRLMLLSAGNDPKVAEVFAHAELKRASCGDPKAGGDWLTGVAAPKLRGRM